MAVKLWVNGANYRFNVPCEDLVYTIETLPPTPPPNPALRPYPGVRYNWAVVVRFGNGVVELVLSGSGFSPAIVADEIYYRVFYVLSLGSSPVSEIVCSVKWNNFGLTNSIEDFRLDPQTPEPGAPNDPNRRDATIYRLKVFLNGTLHSQSDYARLPNVQKQCEGDCPPGCRKVVLSKNTPDYCCCPVKCC